MQESRNIRSSSSSSSIPILRSSPLPITNNVPNEPVNAVSQQILEQNPVLRRSSEGSSFGNATSNSPTNSNGLIIRKAKLKHPCITGNTFYDLPRDCGETSSKEGSPDKLILHLKEEIPIIITEELLSDRSLKERAIVDSKYSCIGNVFPEFRKTVSFSSGVVSTDQSNEQKPQRDPSPREGLCEKVKRKSSFLASRPKSNSFSKLSVPESSNTKMLSPERIEEDNFKLLNTTGNSIKLPLLCQEIDKIPYWEYHFTTENNADLYFHDLNLNDLTDRELLHIAWKKCPETIVVNGHSLSCLEGATDYVEPKYFWSTLFGRFYLEGYEGVKEDKAKDLANAQAGLMYLYREDLDPSIEIIETIPCLKIVKLMVKDNSENMNSYFKLIFPEFFSEINSSSNPGYSVKHEPGIFQCKVLINKEGKFHVEQLKKMHIMLPGENKIATITYVCLEEPSEWGQDLKFGIKKINCKVHKVDHWEKIMGILTSPNLNSQNGIKVHKCSCAM